MGKNLSNVKTTFYFCDGGSCRRAGSELVLRSARAYLRNEGLWDETHTIRTRCNGRCEDAPTCIVQMGNYWYKKLSVEKMEKVLHAHLNLGAPYDEALLYKEGAETVDSDKERPTVRPKSFHFKVDEKWGECWFTKGFSSDQYLYPLCLKLQEQAAVVDLELPNKSQIYPLTGLEKIDYTDDYGMDLFFQAGESFRFNIGPVPKTAPEQQQQQKISTCLYFHIEETGERKIVLKNKMGELAAIFHIQPSAQLLWEYIEQIQLLNTKVPGR